MGKISDVRTGVIDVLIFRFPYLTDIALAGIVYFVSVRFTLSQFSIKEKASQLSFNSLLISSDISLAGFALAALTIITAIKSNISSGAGKTKVLAHLFDSKHYDKITKTFRTAIVELLLASLALAVVNLYSDYFKIEILFSVNAAMLLVSVMPVFRGLCILYGAMNLEVEKPDPGASAQ